MGLNFVPAYGFPSETGELFREYTDMLIAGDPSFKEYLVIQDYDEELKHLEGKYGFPYGSCILLITTANWPGVLDLGRLTGRTVK